MPKKDLTVQQYADLGYKKLHNEIRKMVVQSQRMTVRFNADKRIRLLPALMAMKGLVAQPGRRLIVTGQPNWEDECRLLGLSAEQVRQWKHRTASETDIRLLLGEHELGRPWQRPVAVAVAPTQEYHRLVMLTKAILYGDKEKVERLAQAFAEEYGL